MWIRFVIFIFLTIPVLFTACDREYYSESKADRLSFTNDSVIFDTVFTGFTTANKTFMVYNKSKKALKIASIRLGGGDQSPYRLNVDGYSGTLFSDVEIAADDSLYIFVAVNISPLLQNNPILIDDSLTFQYNDNRDVVKLVAVAQDVHLLKDSVLLTAEWTNDKPYLIFNNVWVDTSHTLTIKEGCRIFMHTGAQIIVRGTLKIEGSLNQPVIMAGHRTEEFYVDIPSQYGGLVFEGPGSNHTINYLKMTNGNTAIKIGKPRSVDIVSLTITNSKFINFAASVIEGYGAEITAGNSLFANSCSNVLKLQRGGKYRFEHCTVAGYGVYFCNLGQPSVLFSDYVTDSTKIVNPENNLYFANSILYGNYTSELTIRANDGDLNYFFQNSVVKLSSNANMPNLHYSNSVIAKVNFVRPLYDGKLKKDWDFSLDTLSSAKDMGAGDVANKYPLDINGNSRFSDGFPDAGAFERIEK